MVDGWPAQGSFLNLTGKHPEPTYNRNRTGRERVQHLGVVRAVLERCIGKVLLTVSHPTCGWTVLSITPAQSHGSATDFEAERERECLGG